MIRGSYPSAGQQVNPENVVFSKMIHEDLLGQSRNDQVNVNFFGVCGHIYNKVSTSWWQPAYVSFLRGIKVNESHRLYFPQAILHEKVAGQYVQTIDCASRIINPGTSTWISISGIGCSASGG